MVDIDHVCCLAHARAKFQYAARTSGDKDAEEILGYIAQLYAKEKTYREAGLNDAQIRDARKSASSLEIVGLLRSKMDVLLAEGHTPREELMEKAVRYLDTFWKQILRYLENGRYSINNNIAERYIRPLAGEKELPVLRVRQNGPSLSDIPYRHLHMPYGWNLRFGILETVLPKTG